MAQDPYGYADAAPAGGDAGGAASVAVWSGVGALICGMAAPCCCYMSYLAVLPLSIVALWQGVQGQKSTVEGERTAATAGIVSGSVGLCFSLIWLAAMAFYALYLFFVIFAIALSGGN